jgi:hypothetical protein
VVISKSLPLALLHMADLKVYVHVLMKGGTIHRVYISARFVLSKESWLL